ncbi:DUF6702 family protein [Mucilaginibacter glaciei]|uniref:Uncharacterized protein n=1 Tax=Mucilaginibacter glaciei TaxID=2772109 RepID=A0A926NGL5_9SPHI|nr:DUF6702 family protein [Mucilaginibacter glaciei]MBD1391709.1 hypothetical protein [Mucilaginibacter glaciei]
MSAFLAKSLLYCYIFSSAFFVHKVHRANFHPLHVSTTDVSFNAQDGQMEVICTIFTDDFETALEKQFHTKADLNKADMHKAMDVLVKNYVDSHLQLKTGTAPLALNYLGFEINREAVNVFLESAKMTAPKRIDAEISLLQNVYDDQLNIVHMTVAGNRKSAKLDYPNKKITQVF